MGEVHEGENLQLDEVITVLEATPGILRTLLPNLPDEWIDFQEDAGAWSPRTVLVHFLHNERTNWIPRAKVILSDDQDRRFVPFQQLPAPGEIEENDVVRLTAEFAKSREASVAILRAFHLRPQDYGRTGQHPSLGTVTLGQLLATWVVHDLNHLHQILKSLAKRQREAVGPWRRNLAILDLG
ncbi:MAG: DinB family protein [Anaerolineales bacterium]